MNFASLARRARCVAAGVRTGLIGGAEAAVLKEVEIGDHEGRDERIDEKTFSEEPCEFQAFSNRQCLVEDALGSRGEAAGDDVQDVYRAHISEVDERNRYVARRSRKYRVSLELSPTVRVGFRMHIVPERKLQAIMMSTCA